MTGRRRCRRDRRPPRISHACTHVVNGQHGYTFIKCPPHPVHPARTSTHHRARTHDLLALPWPKITRKVEGSASSIVLAFRRVITIQSRHARTCDRFDQMHRALTCAWLSVFTFMFLRLCLGAGATAGSRAACGQVALTACMGACLLVCLISGCWCALGAGRWATGEDIYAGESRLLTVSSLPNDILANLLDPPSTESINWESDCCNVSDKPTYRNESRRCCSCPR